MAVTIIIYGPTASGKTALGIDIAKKYNGEIISCDSRQVYRSLDIGTGKITFDSKIEKHKGYWVVDGVKILGFDLVSPGENFSAAEFIKSASTSLIRIHEVKKIPIIVGGTGFYIKALIGGLGTMGVAVNKKLRKDLDKLSASELYKKLAKINPNRAKLLNESDRQNPRRLIRAIEIAHANFTPGVSSEATMHTPGVLPSGKYLLLGLTAPNKFLFQKADKSLKKRLNSGLVEEVEDLVKSGVSTMWLESLGLEYRWITRYLTKTIDKNEAIKRLQGDTHSFIRRQKTWFRKFKDINLVDISRSGWQKQVEKIISRFLKSPT